MASAWREAAQRAYTAAHGAIEAGADADDEPPGWRWSWSRRTAVVAVLALALVAVGVAVVPRSLAGGGDREAVAMESVAPTTSAVPFAAAAVVVHVAGAVAEPGVYELPSGARVQDAIDAAGGALVPADLDVLNLARVVVDGERLAVGEAADAAAAGGADGKVNVNVAGADALTALPGVGPVLAQRIVDYREEHGPFASVEALDAVSGIGPAVLEGLRDAATV